MSAETDARRVRVVRVRMPRDQSFIYARLSLSPGRFAVDVRLIRRRYYSPKRVEYMSLRFAPESAGSVFDA